eukprot:gnl/TRDRNA2_/TRDRNA2_177061_c0_seq1.p1 gnl/TRDRNA2_/TRDRNA2_177061_c0~~gnl/TRDRNA2_/TRDRNA2_177061_c0_seq1.p1  ORF type:complete len:570 (+),score=-23.23 gnl/TRDRNA2_/TRDRNA2_177061_c0_seq1:137-1846(+)
MIQSLGKYKMVHNSYSNFIKIGKKKDSDIIKTAKDCNHHDIESIQRFIEEDPHLNTFQQIQYSREPSWGRMRRMTMFEFYKGLRIRNWTCQFYDSHATPWQIEIFQDSGRFLRLNEWEGYRAVVSTPDGIKRCVDLNFPGAASYMDDYLSGGTLGAIYRSKRGRKRSYCVEEYGYNQVLEELFGAYEQRFCVHERNKFFDNDYWIDADTLHYDAPGSAMLDISWHWTVPEYTVGPYIKGAPKMIFWLFTYSFIAIAIGISLFTNQKKPPMDIQGAVEFAYSKSDAKKDGSVETRFCDLAGLDDVIEQLKEVVQLLKHPESYNSKTLRTRPTKGILLNGPPGTGKTLLAKAIAGEAGVSFYQMSGAEFIQAIVGVGAARVRDLFRRARVNKPCVIFIDEIDAIGVKRAEAGIQANEEREQTLNQLLTEIDGFSPMENIVVVAATNRVDLLDPALLRAGRLEKKISINKPDVKGREAVMKVHGLKYKLNPVINLAQCARDTPGFSPAELANLLNESGLEIIRRLNDNSDYLHMPENITDNDFSNALDRLQYGIKTYTLPSNSWLRNLFFWK